MQEKTKFLSDYLDSIKDIDPNDKELTYRTALENLLKDLCEINNNKIKPIHEPKNDKQGKGAPDFLISNNGLTIGYIENKRVTADLDSTAKSPQIEKYLQLSDNIMLTDYLRFCLVRKDSSGKPKIIKELRICELSQIKTTLKYKANLESKAQELVEFFNIFFTHKPKTINTAKEFVDSLSLRTRILKDKLLENKENDYISSLFNTFKEALYKELDFATFCDSFAQTLTYSLFLARLNNNTSQEIDLYNAKKFIPKSFPLIREMSGFLNKLNELDSIKWLLEEILQIINHINIAELTKEPNQVSEKDLFDYIHKDPYLHFYETFLSSYDPESKGITRSLLYASKRG